MLTTELTKALHLRHGIYIFSSQLSDVDFVFGLKYACGANLRRSKTFPEKWSRVSGTSDFRAFDLREQNAPKRCIFCLSKTPIALHVVASFLMEEVPLLNDLQILIKLQEIDTQLYELERSKGDLPRLVKELDDRVKQFVLDHKKKSDDLAEASTQKRSLEGALQVLREKRKKYEGQLYTVTNNREYDAVTIEIESADLEIDNDETQVIELIDREQVLTKEVAELSEHVAQAQKDHDEQRAILDARLAEMRSQVDGLQARRSEFAAPLKPQVLGSYNRTLHGKEGLAVVQMIRGSCGGCSTRIPPQRAMEIREMDRIILCESCGRILVPAPEIEASIAA